MFDVLQVQMPQNGTNKIFSNKQGNDKGPLIFLEVKLIRKR